MCAEMKSLTMQMGLYWNIARHWNKKIANRNGLQ